MHVKVQKFEHLWPCVIDNGMNDIILKKVSGKNVFI